MTVKGLGYSESGILGAEYVRNRMEALWSSYCSADGFRYAPRRYGQLRKVSQVSLPFALRVCVRILSHFRLEKSCSVLISILTVSDLRYFFLGRRQNHVEIHLVSRL
jgi:hypothetical protein